MYLVSCCSNHVQLETVVAMTNLGLVDEEVGVDGTEETSTGPDPEYLGLETSVTWASVDEVRGSVANTKVP